MRSRLLVAFSLVAAAGLLGCGEAGQSAPSDPLHPPTISFFGGALTGSGSLDPALVTAWSAALADPAGGLDYSFRAQTHGLPTGAQVDLVMARNLNLYANGLPVTDGDYMVEATTTRDDGWAEFDPLGVATANWSAVDHAVPAALLCGETIVMARAMDASGTTIIASTYLFIVTAPCP